MSALTRSVTPLPRTSIASASPRAACRTTTRAAPNVATVRSTLVPDTKRWRIESARHIGSTSRPAPPPPPPPRRPPPPPPPNGGGAPRRVGAKHEARPNQPPPPHRQHLAPHLDPNLDPRVGRDRPRGLPPRRVDDQRPSGR